METPLLANSYSLISKEQILSTFKTSCPRNESLQPFLEILPEIFSNDKVEPENFQPALDFNIDEVLLETTPTPKPLRLVTQKRVYIPKSPFTTSGYADDPTLRIWYYLDEEHNVQGPFTSLEMDFWFDSGFFFNELLIRIKENNDFVKLIHLFGKTEMIQVYKPALSTPLMTPLTPTMTPVDQLYAQQQQQLQGVEAAPRSCEQPYSRQSSGKTSIYTFGFDAEESMPSPVKVTEKGYFDMSEALKMEVIQEETPKSLEKEETQQEQQQPAVVVLTSQEEEKAIESKNDVVQVQKNNSETQEDVTTDSNSRKKSANTNYLDVKGQYEDKNLLSPSGFKKQGRPESSKKHHSYVEVSYEPKLSPSADKRQQDTRKNKSQSNKQGTVLQYVVKGEKKEETEPANQKREKNNTKGKNNKEDQAAASTPGKKPQSVVIFVPKKKGETTYVEKNKSERRDTPDKIYVPKKAKETTAADMNLQPGFLQRKESDTFEILKATSEYYQTDTISAQEDSKQSLPPGLQPENLEPVMTIKSPVKKPKEKLRLVSHPYDEYQQAQDRIVATSVGLLELEEESTVNKKAPGRSSFKNNSSTPSPLIIDNKTVGKLYNFSEDLKYSSFANQTENFADKEC